MIKNYVKNTCLNSKQLEEFNRDYAKEFIQIRKILRESKLNQQSIDSLLLQYLDSAFYTTAKSVLGLTQCETVIALADSNYKDSIVTFIPEVTLVSLLEEGVTLWTFTSYQQLNNKLALSSEVYKKENGEYSDAIAEELRHTTTEVIEFLKSKTTVH